MTSIKCPRINRALGSPVHIIKEIFTFLGIWRVKQHFSVKSSLDFDLAGAGTEANHGSLVALVVVAVEASA